MFIQLQQPKPTQLIQRPRPVQLIQVPQPVKLHAYTVHKKTRVADAVQFVPDNTPVRKQKNTAQSQPKAKRAKQLGDTQSVDGTLLRLKGHYNREDTSSTVHDVPLQTYSPSQKLNAAAENEHLTDCDQTAEHTEEVRYVQLPDGSVQLELVWYEPA